ncbi:MAG: DotU family type IV/VI secretion system protein [Planctomycetota bacterium]|jgi:type VI secretion system protein ImpK
MSPEFAAAVDRVFLQVLRLLERIASGEDPLAEEQRQRIRGWLEQAEGQLGARQDWKLAKFAMVGWIDDVLIDAPWGGRDWWKENSLEVELFGSLSANEQFYVKAREASSLPNKDALEVFYLCVVLGFRGLYRDPVAAAALAEPLGLPSDLETWAKQTAMAIRLGQGRPPISDASREGDGAPPLAGVSTLIWSALAGVVLAAFTVIIALRVFLP